MDSETYDLLRKDDGGFPVFWVIFGVIALGGIIGLVLAFLWCFMRRRQDDNHTYIPESNETSDLLSDYQEVDINITKQNSTSRRMEQST